MIFDFRLQVFHTVARRLSFTKAADELYISQPAVTKHIKELEHQFSSKLFIRQGNNIALTDAGKTLLLYTQELLSIYNKIEEEMGALLEGTKGTLRIGASTTIAQYIIPSRLADFRLKHKDINIKFSTKNTEEIEQDLLSGEIDLGFIEGYTRNKEIKYIPFLNDEIVLVGKTDHPLATRRNLATTDLPEAKLVMREHGSGTLEVVRQALKNEGISWDKLNIDMQLDSTEAIKTYLLYSDTLSFISRHAVNNSDTAHLYTIIPLKNFTIERPLYAIHLQGTPSRLAALFLKFVLQYNFM